MVGKISTRLQVSAGGVVFKGLEVAIISTSDTRRWQLPKGLVAKGEAPEVAAAREVREETGLEGELIAPIDTIEYWYYSKNRVRFHKFVHFYLFRYVSGDIHDHDQEVAEARWVEIAEAYELLAFKSEKEIVRKTKEMIGSSSP